MKCSTHIATGALAGAIYVTFIPVHQTMVIPTVIMSAIGGMLPDIDHKSSFISNLLIFPKALPLKHRGITHSFASSMFTTLCVWVFGRTAAIMWFVGYLSHLVIDYLNTKGEQLFWPMPNRFCLKLCIANSPVSRFLFYLGALVVILSTARVFIL